MPGDEKSWSGSSESWSEFASKKGSGIFGQIQGFPKLEVPQMDGFFEGKSIYKWMIFWGFLCISGSLYIFVGGLFLCMPQTPKNCVNMFRELIR